jgi:hypothetical protein
MKTYWPGLTKLQTGGPPSINLCTAIQPAPYTVVETWDCPIPTQAGEQDGVTMVASRFVLELVATTPSPRQFKHHHYSSIDGGQFPPPIKQKQLDFMTVSRFGG